MKEYPMENELGNAKRIVMGERKREELLELGWRDAAPEKPKSPEKSKKSAAGIPAGKSSAEV